MISRNFRQLISSPKMNYSTVDPSKFRELKDARAVYRSDQDVKSTKSYQLLNLIGL